MQKIKSAAYVLIFLLLLYAFLRLLFFYSYFSTDNISWKHLRLIIYWGFRLDATGILYANAIFFLYFFLLHNWLPYGWQKPVAVVLLSVINLPLLAVNIIDLVYYQFNFRRSTIDLFGVLKNSLPALGSFWNNWWYLFVLFIVLALLSVRVFARIVHPTPSNRGSYLRSNIYPGICFLVIAGVVARGVTSRPIIPSTPLLYLPAQYQPLATNSTITILYSLLKRQTTLQEKHYFRAEQLDTLFTARQQLHPPAALNKMNVVVFVLESFAKEYMDKQDPLHAKTPFLDSLMAESIVCNNAYANGLESNKGLVALLAGIPPFFDEPFYYSSYSNNNIRGIGTLLKEEGYKTSFFMGAPYDHFGFARFAAMMGIDNYYSMNDYGNKKHYDGNWGIYDHYFLPYVGRQLGKMQAPFLNVVFTVSTHFPYTLPDTLKSAFTLQGQGAEQNSMSYLDYSLRLFFDEVKTQSWYSNTLFVFAADHNIFHYQGKNAGFYKAFRIPVFFHLPGQRTHKEINRTVQQMDMVPSILDLLHYPQPFMSFGKSVFDTSSAGIAVNHAGDLYQAIDSAYLLGYNEKMEKAVYLYNFRADKALGKNLLLNGQLPDLHAMQLQEHLLAVIQYFNYTMLKNKLYVK